MKYLCQFLVPWLRNADANILSRKAREKSAKRNKLHLSVIHIDDDAAAESVITMHQGVEQSFTNSFFGVILLIRANNSFDRGNSLVAQSKIVYRIIKLLEYGTAELLAVTKLCAEFIFEHGNFDRVMALVGKQQRKVGVHIVSGDAQSAVFLDGKLHAVALECSFGSIKGQFLFQTAGIFVGISV